MFTLEHMNLNHTLSKSDGGLNVWKIVRDFTICIVLLLAINFRTVELFSRTSHRPTQNVETRKREANKKMSLYENNVCVSTMERKVLHFQWPVCERSFVCGRFNK